MKKEVLYLEHLTLKGSRHTVRDVSILLREGECAVLTGPDHAGFREICEIFAGNGRIERGQIYLYGEILPELSYGELSRRPFFYLDSWLPYETDITLAETLFLVRKNSIWKRTASMKAMNLMTERLFGHYGVPFSPTQKLRTLKENEKRMFSLLWAVNQGARLLALYKVEINLTRQEIQELNLLIRRMQEEGISFLIGTGRAQLFYSVADCVIVMKHGAIQKKLTSKEEFSVCEQLMKTEWEQPQVRNRRVLSGNPCFRYEGLHYLPERQFGLELYRGETIIFASQNSFWQETLWKDLSFDGGMARLWSNGSPLHCHTAQDLMRHRIVPWISGDFSGQLSPNLDYGDNLLLPSLKRISQKGFYQHRADHIFRDESFFEMTIDPNRSAPDTEQESLSLLIHRWRLYNPSVMLMWNFFSNTDMEAHHLLKKFIRQITERGTAVVLVEAEPCECLELCDRLFVLEEEGPLEQSAF